MSQATYDSRVRPHEHEEGAVTSAIENVTSQIPSGVYLTAAMASIGLSLGLRLAGRRHDALFVGQWAPTILLLGTYNKIVKQLGSD